MCSNNIWAGTKGYRFNENFAMKAGIATDVGGFDHLTYNIGANFEW